jgi:hypothetical protein
MFRRRSPLVGESAHFPLHTSIYSNSNRRLERVRGLGAVDDQLHTTVSTPFSLVAALEVRGQPTANR